MQDLEERVRVLEEKVGSKIGWIELVVTLFVFGIVAGFFLN